MTDRTCKLCGRTLPLAAFQGHFSTRSDKTYHEYTCRQCAALKASLARSKADPAFMDAYRARKRRWAKRRTRARMAALLDRVNAAMSDQLRASNGSAKMRSAGPADSHPTKTHPRTACNGTEGADHVHVGGVKHGY